jgi:MFS family permease
VSAEVGRASTAGLPIRRNTALLAGAMAVNSATLQLVAAMSSLTFVLVTGVTRLLGLGPAIFLVSAALAAVPAGRSMDRFGRVPVLAAGFVAAIAGGLLTSLGTHVVSGAAVIAGFALIGAGAGAITLSRTAAGDMYPPHRRARGIAYVLFGAVFGAVLGPAIFSPIFAGRELEASALTLPWLAAAGMAVVGLVLVLAVRPDPKRIAELLAGDEGVADDVPRSAPLARIVRRPGVVPALVAGTVSFAVMVAVMNLTGYVVVEHRHHPHHLVFPIIGAHVLGMFGLAPVIGALIDRIGRRPALVGGLLLIAVSAGGLTWVEGVWGTAILLFALGLGWNFGFVAATAELADRAAPGERGTLLGTHDLAAGLLGAALVLLGGFVLDAAGVYALAMGAAVAALVPVAIILALRPAPGSAPVTDSL